MTRWVRNPGGTVHSVTDEHAAELLVDGSGFTEADEPVAEVAETPVAEKPKSRKAY